MHNFMRAGLKSVASAILADVEPWLPARRISAAMAQALVKSERFAWRSFFPGGRMPPSTAGKDACRYIPAAALLVESLCNHHWESRMRPKFWGVALSLTS